MSDVRSVATVLPADDLTGAVAAWTAILGVEPTFVDGDRWAQFDVANWRLALAGTDRVSDRAGVMIKVADLDAVCAQARAAGLQVGEQHQGPHEMRVVVDGPDGWPIVLYTAIPRARDTSA